MKDLKAILAEVESLTETAETIKNSLLKLIEQQNADAESTDEDSICLFCKKPIKTGSAVTRGICRSTCYREARRMVVENETTWETLEKANLILPVGATKIGRPIRTKLSKEAMEQLEQANRKHSCRK